MATVDTMAMLAGSDLDAVRRDFQAARDAIVQFVRGNTKRTMSLELTGEALAQLMVGRMIGETPRADTPRPKLRVRMVNGIVHLEIVSRDEAAAQPPRQRAAS